MPHIVYVNTKARNSSIIRDISDKGVGVDLSIENRLSEKFIIRLGYGAEMEL